MLGSADDYTPSEIPTGYDVPFPTRTYNNIEIIRTLSTQPSFPPLVPELSHPDPPPDDTPDLEAATDKWVNTCQKMNAKHEQRLGNREKCEKAWVCWMREYEQAEDELIRKCPRRSDLAAAPETSATFEGPQNCTMLKSADDYTPSAIPTGYDTPFPTRTYNNVEIIRMLSTQPPFPPLVPDPSYPDPPPDDAPDLIAVSDKWAKTCLKILAEHKQRLGNREKCEKAWVCWMREYEQAEDELIRKCPRRSDLAAAPETSATFEGPQNCTMLKSADDYTPSAIPTGYDTPFPTRTYNNVEIIRMLSTQPPFPPLVPDPSYPDPPPDDAPDLIAVSDKWAKTCLKILAEHKQRLGNREKCEKAWVCWMREYEQAEDELIRKCPRRAPLETSPTFTGPQNCTMLKSADDYTPSEIPTGYDAPFPTRTYNNVEIIRMLSTQPPFPPLVPDPSYPDPPPDDTPDIIGATNKYVDVYLKIKAEYKQRLGNREEFEKAWVRWMREYERAEDELIRKYPRRSDLAALPETSKTNANSGASSSAAPPRLEHLPKKRKTTDDDGPASARPALRAKSQHIEWVLVTDGKGCDTCQRLNKRCYQDARVNSRITACQWCKERRMGCSFAVKKVHARSKKLVDRSDESIAVVAGNHNSELEHLKGELADVIDKLKEMLAKLDSIIG